VTLDNSAWLCRRLFIVELTRRKAVSFSTRPGNQPDGTAVALCPVINLLKESNDETITCNHVQEAPGQNNSATSDPLQALRRADLFAELLEGSPRSPRQKDALGATPRSGTMEISIIPWEIFRDALKKQQPRTLDAWLRHWLFANEGVILADQQATVTH
jgi:hypothetical protein